MIIQIALVAVAVLLLAKVLVGRSNHMIRAWKKIGMLVLAIVMIVAVLAPQLVSVVANVVGIGRGTDLLLYVLFSVFLFYVLGQYVRSQDDRDKLHRLARRVAIQDAAQRYRIKR